jgi:hypothetical protein
MRLLDGRSGRLVHRYYPIHEMKNNLPLLPQCSQSVLIQYGHNHDVLAAQG